MYSQPDAPVPKGRGFYLGARATPERTVSSFQNLNSEAQRFSDLGRGAEFAHLFDRCVHDPLPLADASHMFEVVCQTFGLVFAKHTGCHLRHPKLVELWLPAAPKQDPSTAGVVDKAAR